MRNTSVCPQPWIKVSLAILPGLWIIFQQREIHGQVSRELGTIALLGIALGIIGISLIMERRLAAWSLPSLGTLLWVGGQWTQELIGRRSLWAPSLHSFLRRFYAFFPIDFLVNPALLLWGICLILVILVPYFAYKRSSLRIPRLGWGILSLLILATMTDICIYTLSLHWLSLISVLMLSLSLISVIAGFWLSKHEGLTASLLVAACEFVLLTVFLNPLRVVHMYAYESPSVGLNLALLAIFSLPVLGFLVVTPIGMLRSRSEQSQKWWLLLPPLLVLVGIEIVRSIVLRGTPAEYSQDTWLRHSLAVVQLWLPLLLATVLYTREEASTFQVKHTDSIQAVSPTTEVE